MSKIPRSFAFDKRIPPTEYHKYISVDDLLNESFEQIREEFQNYRKLSALKELEKEKIKKKTVKFNRNRKNQTQSQYQQSQDSQQETRDSNMYKTQQKFSRQSFQNSSQQSFNNKKINQKSQTMTNFKKVPIYSTVIQEDDNTKTVILKSMEKINQMRQRCEQLKRRAMQPDFGADFISKSKNTIRKTAIAKDYIFQEKDFEKMEKEDDNFHNSQYKQDKEKQNNQHFFRNRKEIKESGPLGNQGKLSQPYRVIYTAQNFFDAQNQDHQGEKNRNHQSSQQSNKIQMESKDETFQTEQSNLNLDHQNDDQNEKKQQKQEQQSQQQESQFKKQLQSQNSNIHSNINRKSHQFNSSQFQQENNKKKVHYNNINNQNQNTQLSTDLSYNNIGNKLNTITTQPGQSHRQYTMGSNNSHHYQMRKLKQKEINVDLIRQKTEKTLQKIDKNINKFSTTCLAHSVFKEDVNNMRAFILKNARYNKVNRQIQDEYGEDIENACDNKVDKQKQKEKESNILQYIQNVISNPKADSQESYTKNIPGEGNKSLCQEHRQRVIQMRLESVKPIKSGQKITKGTEELLSENKELKKTLMKNF